MIDKIIKTTNLKDKDGNPSGGECIGNGVNIRWQNGPLGRDWDRIDPNVAFIETVIQCVIKRLEFYQNSKFNCDENHEAIVALENAVDVLNSRTKRREEDGTDGTEGTHEGH